MKQAFDGLSTHTNQMFPSFTSLALVIVEALNESEWMEKATQEYERKMNPPYCF